jgi:crotonobetainyl-CoA:carnitine CoA-transferase CaiB-like acyl-CoA transferase
VADIFEDPQYKLRENITLVDSRIGPLAVQNVIPKLSDTPGGIEWLGQPLGAHNDAVFGELLGLSGQERAELRSAGVI